MAKLSTVRQLDIPIHKTDLIALQVDGQELDVVGEIHFVVTRDKLQLQFSALVVKNMTVDFLAGTPFCKINDVYARLATDKIVIQGKYFFNSTPQMAINAKIKIILPELTPPFSYPFLVKANKSATLLPGEGFLVPISTIDRLGGVHHSPCRSSSRLYNRTSANSKKSFRYYL